MNMGYIQDPGRQSRLIGELRELYRAFFYWLTSYIADNVCDFGNEPYLAQRVLNNILDITNVLRRYYGNDAGIYRQLLENQFYLTGLFINNLNIGDIVWIDVSRKELYQNADDIAQFLAGLNPYWSKDRWLDYIYGYINFVEVEETERLRGLCDVDIATQEEIREQSNAIADYMAQGLIRQFNL